MVIDNGNTKPLTEAGSFRSGEGVADDDGPEAAELVLWDGHSENGPPIYGVKPSKRWRSLPSKS